MGMEKEAELRLRSDVIQMNPEIIAQLSKDLETVQRLREAEQRVEITMAKITAKVDKVMRTERLATRQAAN